MPSSLRTQIVENSGERIVCLLQRCFNVTKDTQLCNKQKRSDNPLRFLVLPLHGSRVIGEFGAQLCCGSFLSGCLPAGCSSLFPPGASAPSFRCCCCLRWSHSCSRCSLLGIRPRNRLRVRQPTLRPWLPSNYISQFFDALRRGLDHGQRRD